MNKIKALKVEADIKYNGILSELRRVLSGNISAQVVKKINDHLGVCSKLIEVELLTSSS